MAMVRGLQNPVTKIDMGTFGTVKNKGKEKVCFGCAATNTLCEIGKFTTKDIFKIQNFNGADSFSNNIKEKEFLKVFEDAIDDLRRGSGSLYGIGSYNRKASSCGFAKIKPKKNLDLPALEDNYTKEDLKPYIELAKYQREIKK